MGHEWEVILALAGALQALTVGIIRNLLTRNETLEGRMDSERTARNTERDVNSITLLENNKALAKANDALAVMAKARFDDLEARK